MIRRFINFNDLFTYFTFMTEQEKFFHLLKSSNELRRNNKYFEKEDPTGYNELLTILVKIEGNLHYLEKQEYIDLAKNFLQNKITADDFSYSFMAIYEGINKKFKQMLLNEAIELENFVNQPDRKELRKMLSQIYGSSDSFNLDPNFVTIASTEKELRDWAQILLLKLENKTNSSSLE
jgi:uncharacterized protein YueI